MTDYEETIAQWRDAAPHEAEEPCRKEPPLGVKPFALVAVPRINDLLSGIGRYVNEPNLTRDLIGYAKLWATELHEQLDLIDTMLIYE